MTLLRPNDFAQRVLLAAGAANILGVPFFSRLFTNELLNAVDPATMSNFGLLMIVVWGLLFVALAFNASNGPLVFGALAIEKLCEDDARHGHQRASSSGRPDRRFLRRLRA